MNTVLLMGAGIVDSVAVQATGASPGPGHLASWLLPLAGMGFAAGMLAPSLAFELTLEARDFRDLR